MLRAILCLLTLFTASIAFANETTVECTIQSKKHPELTKGMNKDALCRDMIYALRVEFKEKISGTVLATVVSRGMYSVDFKFQAQLNGVSYKGTGHEDWYPGDAYFTIDSLEKVTFISEAKIDCKVKSKKYPSLEKGWNKETLCNDLAYALVAEFERKIVTAKFRMKDTWMRAYSVGIQFKVTVNGKRYKGYGVQHWSPEGTGFVIQEIK